MGQHDGRMSRRRAFAFTLALAAALLGAAAVQPGCARREPVTPAPRLPGGDVLAATAAPLAAAGRDAAGAAPPADSGADAAVPGAARLEAARTVALFCRLVDTHRAARASELLAAPDAWPRRLRRAAARFTFVSALVARRAHGGALTVVARVRVRPRRGGALHRGVNTLFFTLGRVGTTTGGWLISAVSTRP